MEAVKEFDEPVSIALLPDHPTPCHLRTHTREAVPFVIYDPTQEGDEVMKYDELSATKGAYGILSGAEFMEKLLKK